MHLRKSQNIVGYLIGVGASPRAHRNTKTTNLSPLLWIYIWHTFVDYFLISIVCIEKLSQGDKTGFSFRAIGLLD